MFPFKCHNLGIVLFAIVAVIVCGITFRDIFTYPINCQYPYNYYLKSTSLSPSEIDSKGCVGGTGYWKDTLTDEPYYKTSELQVAHYITDDWLLARDIPVLKSIVSGIEDDTNNLYTLSSLVRPIEPFNSPQIPVSSKCIYYTRFNTLVGKYKLIYRENEQAYISAILEVCQAAKIRGDTPLAF